MAEWKGTNGTSEDPKGAFSDPPVRSRKDRILGGLGAPTAVPLVPAVQSFSRIRASSLVETARSDPETVHVPERRGLVTRARVLEEIKRVKEKAAGGK